jgi:Uma2 family endonuclease
MSVEAWAALSEDEPGELVDGHLEEEEVPTWAHELVVSWLIRVLGAWLVPRGGFVELLAAAEGVHPCLRARAW